MNPGVPETLEELRSLGLRLAVASSSPLSHIEKVLAECGIDGYFEVVESGDELHQSKPNPEIYLLTLDKLGLSADVCCAVEGLRSRYSGCPAAPAFTPLRSVKSGLDLPSSVRTSWWTRFRELSVQCWVMGSDLWPYAAV